MARIPPDSQLTTTIGIIINTSTDSPEVQETGGDEGDIWYHVWWMDLIRVIVSIVIPFCGVIGNTLVILTVVKGYSKQNNAHYLIANLAVTDFLFSLQNVIFSPLPLILRWWPFGEVGCRIRGVIVGGSLAANITALLLISINRYVLVVHPKRTTLITLGGEYFRPALIGTWIVCMLFAIPALWDESLTGSLYFHEDCNFLLHLGVDVAYFIVATAICFIVPSLLLPLMHIHILYVVCASYRKIRGTMDPNSKNSSVWSQIKLSVMLLMVYTAFLVAFLPYFVLGITELFGVTVSALHYQIVSYLMNMQASCNFIIYGIVNLDFRNAYKRLLNYKWLCFCRTRRASVTVRPLVN